MLCLLVIIWPVSYHLRLSRRLESGQPVPGGSIAIISGYRLGFEDGGAWRYDYEIVNTMPDPQMNADSPERSGGLFAFASGPDERNRVN